MALNLAKPKKPKKPKRPAGRPSTARPGTGQLGPSITQGPQSMPPTMPSAPAAFGSFTPPQSTQSARGRSTSESTYQAALRTGRQGIVNAALRLGSPEIINALIADPNFAEYAAALQGGIADPTSQMAMAAKDESKGLEGIDQNANAGNTYFSGIRLDDRDDLSEGFAAQRAEFLRNYNEAYSGLIGMMGEAKGKYDSDMFDFDQQDYSDYLAQQPQATGPDTGAMPKPRQGFSFVQTEGSRRGLSYNMKTDSKGRKWRIYENGDKVRIG